MEIRKEMSIDMLREMLITCNSTQRFAEYKLSYLRPDSPNNIILINEFRQQKTRAEVKINKIESCIAWLTELEAEPLKT
jgi:hypothetical protein